MQRKLFERIERHELHESINRRSGDLGASLIADKTHISPVTCIFARSYTTSYPNFSLMEHRITVRNRWKTRAHQVVPSLSNAAFRQQLLPIDSRLPCGNISQFPKTAHFPLLSFITNGSRLTGSACLFVARCLPPCHENRELIFLDPSQAISFCFYRSPIHDHHIREYVYRFVLLPFERVSSEEKISLHFISFFSYRRIFR